MKKIWHPYTEWEDYKAGMYRLPTADEQHLIGKAVELLSNPVLFREAAKGVIKDWPKSTEEFLSGNNILSKRPWLGRAACQYRFNVPESLTRIAWEQLTEEQQDAANEVANELIKEWNLQEQYELFQKSDSVLH